MRTLYSRFVLVPSLLLLACGGDPTTDDAAAGTGGAGAQTASAAGTSGTGGNQAMVPRVPVGQDIVAYVGGPGTQLHAALRLSDGSFLIGASSPSLDWLDALVPTTELAIAADSAASGRAVLLHVSPDLQSLKAAYSFPPGTVRDVRRIRSSEVPGAATGSIFISGSRDNHATEPGYYIAKLRGNGVSETIRGIDWSYDVKAPPRKAGGGEGESDFKKRQPWDVDGKGRVTFVRGAEYDFNWASVHRLTSDGVLDVVPEWPVHWLVAGGEYRGSLKDYTGDPAKEVAHSGIVMKAGRAGSLRSTSQAAYQAVSVDANGLERQGSFPDDYFFSGPCIEGGECAKGPGYTGYKTSTKPTQRVGGVAVDRRSGDIYIGYSTQSVLPDGNPDFEPAVAAFDAEGKLRWWDRLYQETNANSSPDQYVDGLAMDHINNRLFVLGRCHGNNTINFWRGNALKENPGGNGFQNQFTGTQGNIHISWLGRYSLDGKIERSTYIAEFNNTSDGLGKPLSDPNLDGWPNPNAGWPKLNTTRCEMDIGVDSVGRPVVACTGRRTITTANAHQRMLHFDEGESTWNEFVRVYSAELDTVHYSTLITGVWDPQSGKGGGNTELRGLIAIRDGVLAVGLHQAEDGAAKGEPVPTTNVPTWGAAVPQGETGLMAHFVVDSARR